MNNRNKLKHTLSPQQRKVLKALGEGHSVTKLTAFHQGIGNVHDVIMRLRRMGWQIATHYAKDMNGKEYVTYKLNEEQKQFVPGRLLSRRAA